jgi:hypothetical protein
VARDVDAVLLVYHRPTVQGFKDAATVTEHIGSFARYSAYPIWAINTDTGVRPGLSTLRFRAILLHYSLFGSGVYRLDEELLRYLRETDSYKIAFFQDEYYHCGKRFRFLDDHAVDCVFTCLTEPEFGKVYGAHTDVPRLVSNLPGYASEESVAAAARFAKSDDERTVDVGYRGRPLPPNMGRDALEKTEIATRFAELAAGTDLRIDIGIGETDRLYGDAWYEFMANSRCMLGVESGVSAFDLEDRILPEYERMLQESAAVSIDDLRDVLAPWEDRVYYRTMGPRHFEAAAFRVTQVLYEGRYSDVMQPMVHYIPLKKDFSNFEEVVDLMLDANVRQTITENAHRDLIASGAYSYQRFVHHVDRILREAGIVPAAQSSREDAYIRRSLRRGRLRRQYPARRAAVLWQAQLALHRTQEFSAGVYDRTPEPVLRMLRRGLDQLGGRGRPLPPA